jgi:hypothetical protein
VSLCRASNGGGFGVLVIAVRDFPRQLTVDRPRGACMFTDWLVAQLYIGHPNDPPPLFGLLCDEVPEVGGGARKRRGAEVSKASFDLGMGKTAFITLLSLSRISTGVFLGASRPFQLLAS